MLWDAQRVRETIVRIVNDTSAAFTPDALWPAHPLDCDDADSAPALTPLYFGATGVIWALHYLDALGAARMSPSGIKEPGISGI